MLWGLCEISNILLGIKDILKFLFCFFFLNRGSNLGKVKIKPAVRGDFGHLILTGYWCLRTNYMVTYLIKLTTKCFELHIKGNKLVKNMNSCTSEKTLFLGFFLFNIKDIVKLTWSTEKKSVLADTGSLLCRQILQKVEKYSFIL